MTELVHYLEQWNQANVVSLRFPWISLKSIGKKKEIKLRSELFIFGAEMKMSHLSVDRICLLNSQAVDVQ